MPKFLVKTPLRKDGQDFAPGDTVEMSIKDARTVGEDVLEAVKEAVKNNTGATT